MGRAPDVLIALQLNCRRLHAAGTGLAGYSAVMCSARLGWLVVLVMALWASSSALAQSEGKFAVGAQLSTRTAMGPENAGHVGISLLWRFGQSKTGWGWHYGLNWFNTDLNRSIGGVDTEFGHLEGPSAHGGLRLHAGHRPYRSSRRS